MAEAATHQSLQEELQHEIPELEPKITRVLGLNPKYEVLMPLSILYGGLAVVFSIYSLATSGPMTYGLYFFPGFMLWTLLEYCFHRWNHEVPNWDVDNHAHHHKFPDDPSEFIFDFEQSVPMYFTFFAMFVYICPSYGAAAAAGAGLATCYSAYEWVHLFGHLPQDELAQWQIDWCANHVRHHFGHPRRDYGFTTSFWDVVFGTLGDPNWRFKGDKRTVVFKDNQDKRWQYEGRDTAGDRYFQGKLKTKAS